MNRPTLRQLVIWFLAPALLVGVAGLHAYFAAAMNQTPWEGGGFGMFSTVDKRQARFVRCSLMLPRDTARIQLPDHLHTYVQRLRARPTSDRVGSLVQYLANAIWVATTPDSARKAGVPRYRYRPPYESSERPAAPVEAVRVAVWRYRFVSRPYGLEAAPLVSATRRASVDSTAE